MTGVVVIDTNLMLLLVVGSASKDYIAKHKRLKDDYTEDDFDMLVLLIAQFSEIVLLPHTLTEVSNFVRQIGNPARAKIHTALRNLIMTAPELPLHSASGAQREEFNELGLTDAVILHLCTMSINGISPTLITADSRLADSAHSLGYSVIDYRQEYQGK
ncbi:MAG TPA: PIN domain-containing protein [Stellaceae bacterium]|nr:PIN domain-containing protein [Stellaceae bacterium]